MRRKSTGFTLLETVVVMAIIAITVVSLPPMLQWMRQQGVVHAVNQLRADIQLARLIAINRQRTCTIAFNQPGNNQYTNLLNGIHNDLAGYRGGVQFLKLGPDGKKMADKVAFNKQGMSVTVIPINVFVTDQARSKIYRLQIRLPGGVSLALWRADKWL